MAGYSGWSMSNNAIQAYENGLMPLSKITKDVLTGVGITESVAFIRWLCKKEHLQPSEWHHTSSKFNATDFFDPEEIATSLAEMGADRLEALRKAYRTSRRGDERNDNLRWAHVVWDEWLVGGGWRVHGRSRFEEFDADGIIVGRLFVHPAGVKRLSGSHITSVQELPSRPASITADAVRGIQRHAPGKVAAELDLLIETLVAAEPEPETMVSEPAPKAPTPTVISDNILDRLAELADRPVSTADLAAHLQTTKANARRVRQALESDGQIRVDCLYSGMVITVLRVEAAAS